MNPGQQWGGEIWILPIVEFGLGCGLVVWGRAAWREKKLTRWEIRHARERGLWPPLGEDPTLEHVKRMVQAGETIMAVKLYRQIHGGSFADAKAAVEKLASGSAPPQDAKAQAAAAPPPVAVNADHFWRRLVLVVVLALIAIPTILALFVGLLVSMYDQRGAQANQIAAQHVDQEGWQLLQEGKFDDARKKFTQVVEQFPANVDGWNGLGWTWLHTEHPQVAETNFQKALSLDANCPGALNGLGQIYLSQRNYEAAEKDLLQAAPKESAAWYGLARLFLLEGKFDSAKEWAQKVVDSGQADDTARQMLKAAQEKHVGDELRRMIEPPPHGYNDTHSTNNR
jgi:Tfp pilus assembly protein PilF